MFQINIPRDGYSHFFLGLNWLDILEENLSNEQLEEGQFEGLNSIYFINDNSPTPITFWIFFLQ